MTATTKLSVAVIIVAVLAITTLWGVFAPTFVEADVLPVQITTLTGEPVGEFNCTFQQASEGQVHIVFQEPNRLNQAVQQLVPLTLVFTYQGEPFFQQYIESLPVSVTLPVSAMPPYVSVTVP